MRHLPYELMCEKIYHRGCLIVKAIQQVQAEVKANSELNLNLLEDYRKRLSTLAFELLALLAVVQFDILVVAPRGKIPRGIYPELCRRARNDNTIADLSSRTLRSDSG